MEPEILFHNRYTNKLETEKVYGEKWLKFIYSNPIGKICLWLLVKRIWFSKWYGWRMDRPKSSSKIEPFISKFDLDREEFEDEVSNFKTFNQFFYRKLTQDSRPLPKDINAAIFPADGRHFGFQNLSVTERVFVKGQKFNLEQLFNSEKLALPYIGGSLVLSRLCPTDYHRFHFPVSGKMEKIRLINGSLNSVNPLALRQNLAIFWQNKRYLTFIENDQLGKVAMFLVGATCVGSVHITAQIDTEMEKGSELGYFSFGGSSIITLFPPNKVQLDSGLSAMTNTGYESYAKMGEIMANVIHD